MTFYKAVVPMLARRGAEIRIIEGSALYAADQAAPQMADGIMVETLERGRLDRWWNRFTDFESVPGLRRHLAAAWAMWEQADFGADADIVEACDWGLLFVPAATEAAKPLIVQCHGSVGQISGHDPLAGEETQGAITRLLEGAVLSKVANIQTYSLANAGFWRREGARKVSMIRPACKTEEPQGTHHITGRGLVVGRVQRWKGPQVVCAALEQLGARAPGLDWIGRDTTWGSRNDSASAHLTSAYPDIWGKRITHCPQMPREEVVRRQASALFNLIPSTWDVFNFTVVEAMALGRPAIVSTGAGASELIEDGVNGFLFAAGDAEALAAKIDLVMSASPTRLAEIGEAAKETVRTTYDPEKIAAERIAAYRAAIDDFRRNPPAPIGGWLGDICRPADEGGRESMSFLDHHPLRQILAHSARRVGRKLWPQ